MPELREIHAAFDATTICVYQAFCEEIAAEAVELNRFGPKFRLDRMSWIKPSFGWMLYRSQYGTMRNQERILKITIQVEGFLEILAHAVGSSFDPRIHADEESWKTALEQSEVRFQWDPDRDLRIERLERRAIQLGLRGRILADYAQRWIMQLTDVTDLAHSIRDAVRSGASRLPKVPDETLFPIPEPLRQRLGMASSPAVDSD